MSDFMFVKVERSKNIFSRNLFWLLMWIIIYSRFNNTRWNRQAKDQQQKNNISIDKKRKNTKHRVPSQISKAYMQLTIDHVSISAYQNIPRIWKHRAAADLFPRHLPRRITKRDQTIRRADKDLLMEWHRPRPWSLVLSIILNNEFTIPPAAFALASARQSWQ